jgi:hypothetical protein
MSSGTYDPLAVLVRTHRHVVSRGVRNSDGLRVLLKEETVPSPVRQGALQREFDLLRHLPPTSAPRPIEVTTREGRDVLVLEDQDLLPLATRIESGTFAADAFLRASIGLCHALADLHDRGLVVGAISPQSILLDDRTGAVQLLDLSLAQRLPVDVHAMSISALHPTTAGYVAPEQTGRISRTVDHRADLYAVGAVFYEMVTGRRPFDTDDPLELVHSHIARTARPPGTLVPLPEQLSRMIMRLLAKAAEDRYHSAHGLRLDLERCLREWRDNRSISEFDLGAHDFSDRLLIPERLYGRDAELAELTTAFDETLDGRPGLVLVGGYAGVGKTAFINELCRPIVRERGYFISGKFDQVARNVPYSAVLQAFRSLIWQVLSEKEEQLAGWRDTLIGAVGTNGGVLAAVLPEIEFIIGRQPPPVPLDAVESQNRFHFVFRNLVGTFARPDHPLVIFLDDLQWVDAATLELLPQILNDADMRSLLVIGAYRDNEITPVHALTAAIDRLEHGQAHVRRITLGPLNERSLQAFLADTLRAGESDVAGLAHLIRQKTDGNPFFVIQFLESLRHDRLLSLDRGRGQWTFRLDTVAAAATTDNVVTLMTQRIQRL